MNFIINCGLLRDMYSVAGHESCRGVCIVWQVGDRQKFRICSFSVSFFSLPSFIEESRSAELQLLSRPHSFWKYLYFWTQKWPTFLGILDDYVQMLCLIACKECGSFTSALSLSLFLSLHCFPRIMITRSQIRRYGRPTVRTSKPSACLFKGSL